jgi:hypothetical protein
LYEAPGGEAGYEDLIPCAVNQPEMNVRKNWRYPEAFIEARWIWTINLVFGNTVLLRKTVR